MIDFEFLLISFGFVLIGAVFFGYPVGRLIGRGEARREFYVGPRIIKRCRRSTHRNGGRVC